MKDERKIDYYDLLGVSEDSGDLEIKRAYRRLAKEFHPDLNPNAESESKFKEITAAYKVLEDPVLRREYDRYRKNQQNKFEKSVNDEEVFTDIDSDYFNSVFGNEKDWSTREAEILHSFYEYLKNKEVRAKGKTEGRPFSGKAGDKRDKKMPPGFDHPLRNDVLEALKIQILRPKLFLMVFLLVIVVFLIVGWMQERSKLVKKLEKQIQEKAAMQLTKGKESGNVADK